MIRPADTRGRPIVGWTIQATCPNCGRTLHHIADGNPAPTCARAIARCHPCRRTYIVQLVIADTGNDIVSPDTAYRRELRARKAAA